MAKWFEKITLIVTATLALGVGIGLFFGVFESIEFLKEKPEIITLSLVASLILYLLSNSSATEQREREREQRLLEQMDIRRCSDDVSQLIEATFAKRANAVELLIRDLKAHSDSQTELVSQATKRFHEAVSGNWLGTPSKSAWDFTLSIISEEETHLFHPSLPTGNKIREDGPIKKAIALRNGTRIWINSMLSEQAKAMISSELDDIERCENKRITKTWIRECERCKAFILVDMHINLIERLPVQQITLKNSGYPR